MNIIPIKAFKDNYIWAILDKSNRNVWVVDPGDANPVLNLCKEQNFTLQGILLTHHHNDHSGGIAELLHHWENIPVYGSHLSPIRSITHRVKDKDKIHNEFFHFSVLEIPGHTLDHLAYYDDQHVFCGDTLFSAGCGRIFEGTPAQLYQSLLNLTKLSDQTKVYCGHEYTLSNLYFAQHLEPDSLAISNKIREIKSMLEKDIPTLPSLLSEEKIINPFLRCSENSIISAVEAYTQAKLHNPIDVFANLREWKNTFKHNI